MSVPTEFSLIKPREVFVPYEPHNFGMERSFNSVEMTINLARAMLEFTTIPRRIGITLNENVAVVNSVRRAKAGWNYITSIAALRRLSIIMESHRYDAHLNRNFTIMRRSIEN